MKPVKPIDVRPLFPELSAELISTLRTCSIEDWGRLTACAPWTVKEVAAHLLDGNIRRLSFQRDSLPMLPPETPIHGYEDLVAFLNQMNDDWIRVSKRFSPRMLVELLEWTDEDVYQLFKSLPLEAPAMFSVAWAGEEMSQNWFDVAREYTEKWMHQQHIREALNLPLLTNQKWLQPVLDTFMRALPHVYRDVSLDEGAILTFEITGEAGGNWSLVRQGESWKLYSGEASNSWVWVQMDQNTAWRLFTKGMDIDTARPNIQWQGDPVMAQKILQMVAIMA